MGQLGLFEVGLDPDLVRRHQREERRRSRDIVADLELLDLGDDAIFGSLDLRVGEIEFRAVERRLRVLHHRVLFQRKVGIATDVGERHGDILLL
jgi:hypothetical protein